MSSPQSIGRVGDPLPRGNQTARQKANNEARAAAVGKREYVWAPNKPLYMNSSRLSDPVYRGAQTARQKANNEARAAAVGTKENLRASGKGGMRRRGKTHRKSHRKGRKGTRRH